METVAWENLYEREMEDTGMSTESTEFVGEGVTSVRKWVKMFLEKFINSVLIEENLNHKLIVCEHPCTRTKVFGLHSYGQSNSSFTASRTLHLLLYYGFLPDKHVSDAKENYKMSGINFSSSLYIELK